MMFETEESKERRRKAELQLAGQAINMRGRCPRCEGKFLATQTVCAVDDEEYGRVAVHEGCVLGSTVLDRHVWKGK